MNSNKKHWKAKLHEIIFEADTPTGKLFDVVLLWSILISVVTVMLESVDALKADYGNYFTLIEWTFTFLFSLEYIARIITINKPLKYVFSFYGIVDLLSILPTFLGIVVSGTHSLSVIRSLRLLRIFRVLKLGRFLSEANGLKTALIASKQKIIVFLFAVVSATVILGTLMYIVESKEAGFTSIPKSIYWAIVTLTTVGYGDIAPQTVLGQMIASFIMIIGYGIIAVPTGIVGAEISKHSSGNTGANFGANTSSNGITNTGSNIGLNTSTNTSLNASSNNSTQSCSNCSLEGHDTDASHCKYCGSKL